jgi:hypothetical protein
LRRRHPAERLQLDGEHLEALLEIVDPLVEVNAHR